MIRIGSWLVFKLGALATVLVTFATGVLSAVINFSHIGLCKITAPLRIQFLDTFPKIDRPHSVSGGFTEGLLACLLLIAASNKRSKKMFNAVKYTQELESAGFSHEQAKASMKILIDVMNENFATKSDIKELDMKIDMLEYKLVFKLGALATVLVTFATGVLSAVIKFSH
jgi:hypothetical protein